jgi:hypothetical protein
MLWAIRCSRILRFEILVFAWQMCHFYLHTVNRGYPLWQDCLIGDIAPLTMEIDRFWLEACPRLGLVEDQNHGILCAFVDFLFRSEICICSWILVEILVNITVLINSFSFPRPALCCALWSTQCPEYHLKLCVPKKTTYKIK